MAAEDLLNNIVKLSQVREEKEKEQSEDLYRTVVEFVKKQSEELVSKEVDERIAGKLEEKDNKIRELKDLCMKKDIKIQNSFPQQLVVIAAILLSISVATISLIVFQIISNYKIIDFYILIYFGLLVIGLLCTTIKAIKIWNGYIKDES